MAIASDVSRCAPEVCDRVPVGPEGRFVLALDVEAIALTGPHGQSYEGL
ncbi:hypothetical protein [Brevibacterium zhoupengii]|nr:hypothetical protein [Brevibacterium zhoupengii]